MSSKTNSKKTKGVKNYKNEFIVIKGARVNNLKNINVAMPKNKFVVVTGISGSGKSSLAFDTLYAEGRRRYVESLSSYARQFLGSQDKPDVDQILGLSPAIAIDQKTVSHNPRSTVGTITEIYDYLRLLFARIGQAHCPECGAVIAKQTKEQIIEKILSWGANKEILVMAPLIKDKKGEHKKVLEEISKAGFSQIRLDKEFYPIQEALDMLLDKDKPHDLEVVIDQLAVPENKELVLGVIDKNKKDTLQQVQGGSESQDSESKEEILHFINVLNTALDLGNGLIIVYNLSSQKEQLFSEHLSCPKCDFNLPEIEPRLFSFNSPQGACPACSGLGVKQEVDPQLVIPNKKLTIAQGAIRPWVRNGARNNSQLMMSLEKMAAKHGFSIHTPVKDLTKKQLDKVLYGSNGPVRWSDKELLGSASGFEGIIPNLMKKYQQANSDYIKSETEKYMRLFVCPECQGKRLNKIALGVKVADKNIAEVCEMTIEECQKFFSSLS